MKSKQHIKIEKRNIEKLKALDCIRRIEEDKTGNITCFIFILKALVAYQ